VVTESPKSRDVTDAGLLLLGLVAEEMPRHGYQLDQEIERRRLREWARQNWEILRRRLAFVTEAAGRPPGAPRASLRSIGSSGWCAAGPCRKGEGSE